MARWQFIGKDVLDADGSLVGKVMDTHPADGGGEIDLLLVHVGRTFPRRRWLPVEGVQPIGEAGLFVKWPRWKIEDSPDAGDRRWGSPSDHARAYWLAATD